MKIFSFILRNRWLFILLLLFSVLIAGIRAWNAYYTNLGIESGFFDNFYSALQTPIANANFPIDKQPRAQIPISLEILRIAGPLIVVFGIFALLEEFGAVFSKEIKYLVLFFSRKPTLFFGVDSNVALLVRKIQMENAKSGYLKKKKCAIFIDTNPMSTLTSDKNVHIAKENLQNLRFLKRAGPGKTQDISITPDKNVLIFKENFGDLRFLKRIKFRNTQGIFVHLGDDIENMSLVSRIEELCPYVKQDSNEKEVDQNVKNSRKTTVLIHLSKPENLQWFKENKGEDPSKGLDLRAINFHFIHASFFIDEIAQELISRYLSGKKLTTSGQDLPIVLAGLTEFGEHCLLEIAMMFHFLGIERKKIVILDDNVEEKVRSFYQKYPDFCLLNDISLYPLEKVDFMRLDVAFKNEEESKTKHERKKEEHHILDRAFLVITTLDSVLENLQTCRELRNYYLRARNGIDDPLIYYFSQENRDTVFTLLKNDTRVNQYERALKIRGYDCSEALTLPQIFENIETNDKLAKAMHNEYLKLPPEQADILDIKWAKLTDYFKEENRYPARHLYYKLNQAGFVVVDNGIKEAEVSPDLYDDNFRKLEHNRWAARKILNGYRYLENQDDTLKEIVRISGSESCEREEPMDWKKLRDIAKVHKSLVVFEELPDEEKKKDDATFGKYQELLGNIGKKAVEKSKLPPYTKIRGNTRN